jgi:hypothetical protein
MARRTVALINVLTDDHVKPSAVAEVLRGYGETEPIDLTTRDISQMYTAATRLREIFTAEHVDQAAVTVNRLLTEHTGPLRLSTHGGDSPWHPHLDRDDDGPWDEWLLSSSCLALTVLIWNHQRPPGGVCASPSCDKVFITQGSGPERRYCSRRCATRERVAAHRHGRSRLTGE